MLPDPPVPTDDGSDSNGEDVGLHTDDGGIDFGRTMVSPPRAPQVESTEEQEPLSPERTVVSPPRPFGQAPSRPGDTIVLSPRETREELGFLVMLSGERRGEVTPVVTPRTVIGRSRDSGLFLDDDAVSGQHASIRCEVRQGSQQAVFVLHDLDSENGTEVNGQRITGETVLSDGDRLRVGRSELAFKMV